MATRGELVGDAWSDGITLLGCFNANVYGNYFLDNTDLIIGEEAIVMSTTTPLSHAMGSQA